MYNNKTCAASLTFLLFLPVVMAASTSLSPITIFLHEGGRDPLGRTHDEMLQYSMDRMEECHDYIQWLFPLHEESAYAQVYPVLLPAEAALLAASPHARRRMRLSLARLRLFWGLCDEAAAAAAAAAAAHDDDGAAASLVMDARALLSGVVPARVRLWARPYDHNLLRVTRALRSLRLLGLHGEAASLFAEVDAVAQAQGLDERTRAYWSKAATAPVWSSLRGDPSE